MKQLNAFKEGFYSGLPLDFLKKYRNPCYSKEQLEQIFCGYWLKEEQRNHYAQNLELDGKQMEEIRIGYEHHLEKEQVELYANEKYTARQMEQLRLGIECGHTQEQLSLYQNVRMNWMQMMIIRKAIDDSIPLLYVKLFANIEFHWLQMWQILLAIKDGMPYSVILEFAEPKCKWYDMYLYRSEFARKVQIHDVPLLISAIIND